MCIRDRSIYLKNKEKILNSVCKASDKDRKRARGPKNPDVDECVVTVSYTHLFL